MIRRVMVAIALQGLVAGTAFATTPGDIDGDGDMDLDDLGIWAANYTGSLAPGTGGKMFSDGDLDGDQDCDLDDQGIWSSNFTGSLAPGGLDAGLVTIVPEPGVGVAALLGAAGCALVRRRRPVG